MSTSRSRPHHIDSISSLTQATLMQCNFINNNEVKLYLKASHVPRVPSILQTVLVTFEKEFEEKSAKK